jgi:hydroxyacylglutathione hydrolase
MFTEVMPGVSVATAERFTTTSTAVTGQGGECLLIDPAVTPADLAVLAAAVRPTVGFATHAHWDHLLWSRDLGPEVPRYASARTVAQASDPAVVQQLEESAPGHDLALFAELAVSPGDLLPWDGPVARLVTHDAHEPGHSALFFPDLGVLVAGDMLSDIEIPLFDLSAADPVGDYRAGLERLASLEGVRWLIPGHGHVGDAAEFRRRVDLDRRYLDSPSAGDPRLDGAPDWQRAAHEDQLRSQLSPSSPEAPGSSVCSSSVRNSCWSAGLSLLVIGDSSSLMRAAP